MEGEHLSRLQILIVNSVYRNKCILVVVSLLTFIREFRNALLFVKFPTP